MKMDSIRFTITRPNKDNPLEVNCYEIDLYLNGVKLKGLFNLTEVLSASKFNFAEFDLFTCSCGDAGCAGYHDTIMQTTEPNLVTWTFPAQDYYKTEELLGNLVFRFDKNKFLSEFANLYTDVLELQTKNIFHESLLQYKSESIIDLVDIVKEYDNVNKNINDTIECLNLIAPHLKNETFHLSYDGLKGVYSYSLYSAVGTISNTWSGNITNNFYKAKLKLIVKSIENSLKGDNILMLKIIANAAKKIQVTPYHFIIKLDFPRVKNDSNFNIKKLFLKKV